MDDDSSNGRVARPSAGNDEGRVNQRGLARKAGEMTLHQLRIFWAVTRSETLTKAAKQLGLAQPSLSQQLGKLEANVGTQLFHRRSNELTLTEAGQYLLPKVEQVLRTINELQDGLDQFSGGKRLTLRVAGINSVLRVLLPQAIAAMQDRFPETDFDILESAPAEILELLYGRRVNVGLLAANSVAQASVGFVQVPLVEDPYVLVVPRELKLDGIVDPKRELPPAQWAMLNRSIQFIFGSQRSQRVADWYDQVLPEHNVVAQCRSFETAIGLVRAGAGICLAPALATIGLDGQTDEVQLYRVKAPSRSIVALIPSQYRRIEPYASLLDALQTASQTHVIAGIRATPPWLSIEAPEVS